MGAIDHSTELKWMRALWLASLWVGTVMLPTIPLVVMLIYSVLQLSVLHDAAVMANWTIVSEDVDTWKPLTVGLPAILIGLLIVVPSASRLAHGSWKVAALSAVLMVATTAVVFIIYTVLFVSAMTDALHTL